MISGIIDVEICASISQKVKVLPSFSARARVAWMLKFWGRRCSERELCPIRPRSFPLPYLELLPGLNFVERERTEKSPSSVRP